MNYITTTELRTKTTQLLITLKSGQSVNLIHRSQIVGQFTPKKPQAKPLTQTDIKELEKILTELNLPKTTYKQREKIYRKHLEDKYGKPVLRR